MVPAIVAALFGSSRQLVSGPTTAASIVLFSSLSALAVPGSAAYVQYALTLTFMVGAIQLAMGLARLGTLVNFVSHSVIVGFTSGAAVLIAASQLKNFLGLQMPGGLRFYEILIHLWQLLGGDRPRLGGGGARHPRGGDCFTALLAAVPVHDWGPAGRKPARRDHRVLHLRGVPAPRLGRVRAEARGRGPGDAPPALGPGLQPPLLHAARPDSAGGDPVRP